MKEMNILTVNGQTFVVRDDGAVRADTAQSLTEAQKAQARANIGIYGQAVVTDEKYFTITADGLISLKEEYQNGGSKNAELPAEIVIPEIVNDILVTELAEKMFKDNLAVQKITIPYAVTAIPPYFCTYASKLTEINGTQNVTSIGRAAFVGTAIKKALFPNLTSLEKQAFYRCVYLTVADIGNHITALPYGTFNSCERLEVLIGGAAITTIGEGALLWTSRLKTLSFAPNVRSIEKNGLYMSRVNYDWKKHGEETGCTFGERATYAQLNPTDFWTGKSYKVCENPINSTFNQNQNSYDPDYNTRCNVCTAATIYSALANVKLDDPSEFEKKYKAAVEAKYTGTQADITYGDGVVNFLREAGFEVNGNREPGDWYNVGEDLQILYDSLADGCLVGLSVNDGSGGISHILTAYGVNKDGEIMVVNSSSVSSGIGYFPDDDRAIFYAQPIQNITPWKVGADRGSFMIVKRPETWEG